MTGRIINPDARLIEDSRERIYRHVFIVESRAWWCGCRDRFDPDRDLVLTYDFGLRCEVEARGGTALYVDHLVDPACMQKNNFLTYEFFRNWHRAADGSDLFEFRGIPFGQCFRLEIWNDLIFHARTRLCLEAVKEILSAARVFVGTGAGLVESFLMELGVAFESLAASTDASGSAYFFPIDRWMDEKVRSTKLRHKLKPLAASVIGRMRYWKARLFGGEAARPGVFVQEYYPTRRILEELQKDPRIRVLLAQYSWTPGLAKLFREQPIPVWGSLASYQGEAERLLARFRQLRHSHLVLSGNLDISERIYAVIERRVAAVLAETLRTLDCARRYIEVNPLKLEVMISNLGRVNTLVDCICRTQGVASYLIINGMLTHDYLDEAKFADTINAYATSIKDNYFRGMPNIVCLGDPRMDDYAGEAVRRKVSRENPIVTIGASGHNITNLDSYLAVEFDFLRDVLSALREAKRRFGSLRVVIKVRDNGYRNQYASFVNEYFSGLVDEVIQGEPMRTVLARTDFYISIYSQTLFEASCLGIPCVYYKKDTETLFPPFDGKSELVTVGSVADMVEAFSDFRNFHPRFSAFLQRQTMEKYIGSLDGRNLQRNVGFIYDQLQLARNEKGFA